MAVSSQPSLGSQWPIRPFQTRGGKRTLLTAEEMEDSEDDFDEQDEEDDMKLQSSEPTNPFQQLAISIPCLGQEMMMEDTGEDGRITMSTRDSDLERRLEENMQQDGITSADPTRNETDHNVDVDAIHDIEYGSLRDRPLSPEAASQDRAEDSGRVQESEEQENELSITQVIALKRKKKAIKYLERVCLNLLQQLSDCVKLELNKVRRDVGADESGSEVEDEDPAMDDQCKIHDKADKGINEEGKTGELSIPLLNRASGDLKYLKYPRKASQTDGSTSLALARFLRVCTLMHESLVNDTTVTKRDIYYKDVTLFGKQSTVDALIDDIVATVGLKRADFNMVASPKGLMAASGLTFWMDGAMERLGSSPTLIPHDGKITGFDTSQAPRWILVIEKEATFTTLCASGILSDSELGNGILVTGKGYPDFATLHFLRFIGDSFPSCRIAILVDADAHGLDILSVYQYGSKGMRFTAEAEGLALGERATWIGVKATEWSSLNLDMDKLIPLTEKDQRFAQSMLLEEDLPAEWKRQLNHMLHLRRKAEIQNLDNRQGKTRGAD
ncbi:endodeoxyribonuclease [Naganishia albida]|nr:endodeoxyribonuclease [Naganishia albida]